MLRIIRRLAVVYTNSNKSASVITKFSVRCFSEVEKKKRRGVPVINNATTDSGSHSRYALSLSSWFCLPDEGMKDFEILCRSSAFIVEASKIQSKNASFNYPPIQFQHSPRYHFLTVSHGLAPWRWPKQYQMEENGAHAWLRALTDEHTYFTLEIRHKESGLFSTQNDLNPIVYHHESVSEGGVRRDLAVLHLQVDNSRLSDKQGSEKDRLQDMIEQEELIVKRLQGLGVRVFRQEELVDLSQRSSEELDQATLEFHGHNVCFSSSGSDSADDNRVSIPDTVSNRRPLAQHIQRSQHQVFAFPERPLVDGMCGGPAVLQRRAKNSGKKVVEVVGLLEGVVPADHPQALLRGAAVFVEAGDILRFIRAVEAGHVKPVRGGKAMQLVAADQDPAKMDLESIIG